MTHDPRNPGPPRRGQPVGVAPLVWLFFRFDGRIGREVYWLSIGLLWCVLFVLVGLFVASVGPEEATGPTLLLGLASLWCEMAILVKRQHDWGLPWYWCLLAVIPLVGVVWMIAAGVIAGRPGPNAYGDRTDVPPR